MTDLQFCSLMAPLTDTDRAALEKEILTDGCREPIYVWKNIIIDGIDGYWICNRNRVHFRTKEMEFTGREEAVAWICRRQLERTDLSEERRKYLIGKCFETENSIRKKQVENGGASSDVRHSRVDLMLFPVTAQMQKKRGADPHMLSIVHLPSSTAIKYANYSRALDTIRYKAPHMAFKILSGEYKISHENVVQLSEADVVTVHRLAKRLEQLEADEKLNTQSAILEEIRCCLQGEKIEERRLQPQIKKMPQYDPDAEINGLMLTIPMWIDVVAKTRERADLSQVSMEACLNLENRLLELDNAVASFLTIIREKNTWQMRRPRT